MILSKVLKNISGGPLTVLNVELQNNESYTLPYSLYAKAADSILLRDQISSGQVSVNNGLTDLSIENGLLHVLKFQNETDKANNFSFHKVNNEIIIPEDQQMIVKKRIRVNGRLIIRGHLCLI